MNHIFISYSRKDVKIVDAFTEKLRSEGFDIWQDKSGAGTGIPFSTKWFSVIEEALYLASGAVIFNSVYWKDSGPCKKEKLLIDACALPILCLDPAYVMSDPERAMEKFRKFFAREVASDTNKKRTTIYSSAYELKAGVSPYQLLPHTGGVLTSVFYVFHTLSGLKKQMADCHYDRLNPELYPYMKKYLRFSQNAAIRRAGVLLFGALAAIAALILIQAVPRAIEEGVQENAATYMGLSAAGQMTDLAAIDPAAATKIAEQLDEHAVTLTSYFSLSAGASGLMNARMPERVLTSGSKESSEAITVRSSVVSSLYDVKMGDTVGGLIFTERQSGVRWTVNLPAPPDNAAWNRDGTLLICSAGHNVFVYDPYSRRMPIRLDENFEQVTGVGFAELDGISYAAAMTEQGTVLLWADPGIPRPIQHRNISCGVFIDDDTALFTDGNEVVLAGNGREVSYAFDPEYTILAPGYSVSDDKSLIAFIAHKEDISRIVVMSLADGSIVRETVPDYAPTALVWSRDGQYVYGAGYGCGILRLDLAAGTVEYGDEPMYYHNIARSGDNFVLTDYYGCAGLFDSALHPIKDCGRVNYVALPVFQMAVNPVTNYLFMTNRGGASLGGCTRFNLKTNEIHTFYMPGLAGVDANTAVALSADGAYVAFGYPNGTVRVYEQDQMYLVFERQCIGESVSALRFSEDGRTICVLGESCNICKTEMNRYELFTGEESVLPNWTAMKGDLVEMRERYISGIE